LKDTLASSQNVIEVMAREFKVLENICGAHEKRHIDAILRKIHTDTALFGGVSDEMDRFQRVMMNLLAHGKFESREKDIKIILNNTIKELKGIETV
jgi:hypothetical protein